MTDQPAPVTPPAVDLIPKAEHIALQAEFFKLATALGVELTNGMSFPEAFDRCKTRARAASVKADALDKIIAGLDGAEDAIYYALPCVAGIHKADLTRAVQQLSRALKLLRELTGTKQP